ncbi:MAG: MOSC domain-containing protein [Deltaproteobacteria bacterium]|nr:MOSC domain-containing protein [Deltaproteobacteria bacterium]MBW2390344.1 MOSC domain-containing protein [Deltaproteobacteria bacterium]MBW2725434.1 MOSC domain-containing protein [Deltaproteobacteria bacterium]
MPGKLLSIYIAKAAGEPMQAIDRAELVSGKGIAGDRYFAGTGEFSPSVQDPDHEVTLIEIEQIRAFNNTENAEDAERTSGDDAPTQPLEASEMRRNLLTEGIDLNALVGKTFAVGDVLMRGVRLCEPCEVLRDRTRPSILAGFAHRGGLRAGIVRGGSIETGCSLTAEAEKD